MATFITEIPELGTERIETLAERMASGVLPVFYGLVWAIDVASSLRDYHLQGLSHGGVSAAAIRLLPTGAKLDPRADCLLMNGEANDITAFGGVLYELMTGEKPPAEIVVSPYFQEPGRTNSLVEIRSDATRLAQKCLCKSLDIQHVLIELRILVLLARGLDFNPRRVTAVSTPAPGKSEWRRFRVVGRGSPELASSPARLQLVKPRRDEEESE